MSTVGPPDIIASPPGMAEDGPVAATAATRTAATETRPVEKRRSQRMLLARHGRSWEAQAVAEHLMSCRRQMVCGLRRKTPWAGLDDDTLDSCFGHGAAVIAKVAASGQRPEWRTAKDLEKAQVAAFRHQALDHWKRVNAQSRQGDRLAVAFDPDRHAPQETPMDRLFDQPDLHAIQRDLLAELDDPELAAFWTAVLNGPSSFKTAGDELGLVKAQVMARTRAGRNVFASYLDRRESGELCRERGADILAVRGGGADERRRERAEAHLESCYSCALVHRPQTSAFDRGILSIAPVGLLMRLLSRAGDAASIPATRWAEAGTGARLVSSGLAALTVAGTGIGLDAASQHGATPHRHRHITARVVPQSAPAPVREPFRTPAVVIPARAAAHRAAQPAVHQVRSAAKRTTVRPSSAATRPQASTVAAPQTSAPAVSEFTFERAGAPAPAPSRPAAKPSAPPATEFAGP